MKYLLISDIHGCKPTLEKALAFYKQQHCDMLLILGDILNYGPRNRIPQGIDAKGIVDLLNPLADQIIAIRGNCDAEVDQMLLSFPIMADYALIVDNGKSFFSPMATNTLQKIFRQDIFMPYFQGIHIYGICHKKKKPVFAISVPSLFQKRAIHPLLPLMKMGLSKFLPLKEFYLHNSPFSRENDCYRKIYNYS